MPNQKIEVSSPFIVAPRPVFSVLLLFFPPSWDCALFEPVPLRLCLPPTYPYLTHSPVTATSVTPRALQN